MHTASTVVLLDNNNGQYYLNRCAWKVLIDFLLQPTPCKTCSVLTVNKSIIRAWGTPTQPSRRSPVATPLPQLSWASLKRLYQRLATFPTGVVTRVVSSLLTHPHTRTLSLSSSVSFSVSFFLSFFSNFFFRFIDKRNIRWQQTDLVVAKKPPTFFNLMEKNQMLKQVGQLTYDRSEDVIEEVEKKPSTIPGQEFCIRVDPQDIVMRELGCVFGGKRNGLVTSVFRNSPSPF
ncbi:hypothetical protein L2E82_27695 [Cichorium intybus]|uniref:Uncharacterized protein n=1 Tax=Cichorium intybus TaxID=13427 RepID=A0ACB9CTT0_CICIN|nr:hypothetical protein L2E82_27695 [Cichorium intybus]